MSPVENGGSATVEIMRHSSFHSFRGRRNRSCVSGVRAPPSSTVGFEEFVDESEAASFLPQERFLHRLLPEGFLAAGKA